MSPNESSVSSRTALLPEDRPCSALQSAATREVVHSAEGIDDARTKRAGTACDADGRVARMAGKREFDVVSDVDPRDGAGATPGIAACPAAGCDPPGVRGRATQAG